jgi:hypothetical protein
MDGGALDEEESAVTKGEGECDTQQRPKGSSGRVVPLSV